jgi:hypothetical protein
VTINQQMSDPSVDQQMSEQQNVGQRSSIDSLVSGLASGMPKVESYIEAQRQKTEETKQQSVNSEYSHLKDRYGRAFNPILHEVDGQGKPIITRTNNLKIKPGRPTLSAHQLKPPEEVLKEKNQEANLRNEQSRKMAALVTASSFINISVALFGEDWRPDPNNPTELESLVQATEEYFTLKNLGDLPPSLTLVCAYSMYALPRLNKPKTLSRLEIIKNWFLEHWFKFKNRRNLKKEEKQWESASLDHQKPEQSTVWKSKIQE